MWSLQSDIWQLSEYSTRYYYCCKRRKNKLSLLDSADMSAPSNMIWWRESFNLALVYFLSPSFDSPSPILLPRSHFHIPNPSTDRSWMWMLRQRERGGEGAFFFPSWVTSPGRLFLSLPIFHQTSKIFLLLTLISIYVFFFFPLSSWHVTQHKQLTIHVLFIVIREKWELGIKSNSNNKESLLWQLIERSKNNFFMPQHENMNKQHWHVLSNRKYV